MQIIIESDSQVTIKVIRGDIKAPSYMANIIADILMIALIIRIVYWNRYANKLADAVAKTPILVILKLFLFINNIFLCVV